MQEGGRMDREKDIHGYDDIINLPHHVSTVHPPMPIPDRAAQFSPFAALEGFYSLIKKAGEQEETFQKHKF